MDDTIIKKAKGDVKVVQMSTYTSPSIVEKKNKAWVEYGDDNDYYGYLIDMFHGSPTNNRCIKGIADLIFGQGMEAKRSNRNLPDYVTFKRMFSDECLRNVAQDLKMMGMGSFQIVRSKDKKKLAKCYHFPIQTLRPEKCNDKGEIEAYYYYPDWANMKRRAEPKRIPNFQFNPEASESILVIRPYSTGSFYFSPVDYQGGLQYAELECEIANYHINNIKNGMAPSMLINFNNGEPSSEDKNSIENAILNKFSGSSSTGKVVISWNDSADQKADITPVPLSDAHNQYQFLSTESQDKVLVAHGITSPLIFGIKNIANGFSSNADELTTGIKIFDNMVIRPFQQMVIEAVNQILSEADINLELYFKPLNPLDDDEIESTNEGMALSFKKEEFVQPKTGESRENFLDRCTEVIIGEGTEKRQAFTICKSFWKDGFEFEETYNDYPESASNNAQSAIDYADKNGWGECGTDVGKKRAYQLANKENISRDTIARMASFRRHQENKNVLYEEGCGGLMWDAWGGDSGIEWAERKLKEIDKKKLSFAEEDPCWEGYEMVGFKIKDGRKVPNCVPKESMGINRKGVEMSSDDEMSWLEFLGDKGEIVNENEWELIDTSIVNDEALDGHQYTFFQSFADPDEKSTDDKGIYKIRYRYGPNSTSSNSRDFCKQMVGARSGGVTYRREDIIEMGDAGINGQFAPKGKSTYSIWKFKGGVACHHYWERLTFKRKQNNGGKVMPLTDSEKDSTKRDIQNNYDEVSNASANDKGVPFSPPDWAKAQTKPINMPNQGRLKK